MDNSSAHHVSPSCANRLVLIDGNAILHRAYHALPPLTTPDGTVVNAVYGFVSILIKIFNDLKPTHMAVAFDRAAPTFRKKLYKEYQASRPKMEDALVGQISIVHDVVAAFGIPNFELDGYEADDVIGTLVKRVYDERVMQKPHDEHMMEKSRADHVSRSSAHQSPEVIIVTGDKDILQLVDDKRGVKVFMPTKGLSEGKLYGEAEVVERLGVTPSQIPELKALMGDSSDNYPGVAGIGPKTAVDLITRYENIDTIYRTINSKQKAGKGGKGERGSGRVGDGEKISLGVREKLVKGEEMARMSKDLATIRVDVPVVMEPLEPIETLDTEEARKILQALHFPSLLKRLTGIDDGKRGRPSFVPPGGTTAGEAGEQQELF
ncbi:MAG: 5'-3' exonuclease H3TH domain-containing protein [Patescibacteria group bacterium]